MYAFSTVDGFVEIIESLMDMIKFIANDPLAGIFYVQQHTCTAVPLHTAYSIQGILLSWSAKEKASSFKWPRMDSIESKPAKNDEPSVTCSNDDTTLEADAISCTRGQQR
ncbi:hypothetical protein R3W88_015162 [Solanum pinnatisectum]|uniref:Uncharacterized protein n=1 Tax=Solanum pinnatisectum TaxID=50273 RepID=A0AAV9KW42_9SOLN|nr:hypothetical protein R3W88_015162 [Solanum pinnatisectum]